MESVLINRHEPYCQCAIDHILYVTLGSNVSSHIPTVDFQNVFAQSHAYFHFISHSGGKGGVRRYWNGVP